MASDKRYRNTHIYFADAGTGKSATLLGIIGKHVEEGIPLHRIAFVTFTKAGAEVAKQRVCDKFGIDIKDAPHFTTIHSMCFRACGVRKQQVMDNEKYADFGKKADFKLGHGVSENALDAVDWEDMKDEQIAAFEQLYRNNQFYAQKIYHERIRHNDRFLKYCKEYVRYKQTFGYIDFTDMLQMYIDNDYFEDVDVACIDEAQDCSPLQWRVLFKAFRDVKHFYVAADVKQHIFGWAGGDADILMKLRGEVHYLEKSWRVPRNINNWVKHNIVSQMTNVPPTQCLSERDGGEVIHIASLNELGTISKDKSYMLLARNRVFLKEYQEWCEDNCIPYVAGAKFDFPLFTNKEKQQFRDGQTSGWDKQKLLLAQRYYEAGTFYETPNVRISTIHRVKGDEADIVVVSPNLSKLTAKAYREDPQTEHKMFYVACTRAREALYILDNSSPNYYGEIL